MSEKITGHTRLLGFFADPASHSKSPLMYNTAFQKLGIDCVYLAFQIDTAALPGALAAMRTLHMRGANISMPNKTAVIPYLDYVSPEARILNAVNTIVNDDGVLTGYNTDGKGAMLALSSEGIPPAGKKIVVLGAGGAGSAIISQAAFDGASEVSVFVRPSGFQKSEPFIQSLRTESSCPVSVLDITDSRLLAQKLADADILINATSVGMEPDPDACLIPDTSFLRPELFVMDIIYSPEKTKLLALAEKAGCRYMNGLGMLLYQGAAAFRLYTGEELPVDDVKKAWGIR